MAHTTKDEGLSQDGYHTSRASKHVAAIKVTALSSSFICRYAQAHFTVSQPSRNPQRHKSLIARKNSDREVEVKERSSIILAGVLIFLVFFFHCFMDRHPI